MNIMKWMSLGLSRLSLTKPQSSDITSKKEKEKMKIFLIHILMKRFRDISSIET